MTVTATRSYAGDVAWVEQVVAEHPLLQATKHELYTRAGQLWVRVEGGVWEAHAWQAAVHGRLIPSKVTDGVRRQEIWGLRVHVEVIDDPSKAGAR